MGKKSQKAVAAKKVDGLISAVHTALFVSGHVGTRHPTVQNHETLPLGSSAWLHASTHARVYPKRVWDTGYGSYQ